MRRPLPYILSSVNPSAQVFASVSIYAATASLAILQTAYAPRPNHQVVSA